MPIHVQGFKKESVIQNQNTMRKWVQWKGFLAKTSSHNKHDTPKDGSPKKDGSLTRNSPLQDSNRGQLKDMSPAKEGFPIKKWVPYKSWVPRKRWAPKRRVSKQRRETCKKGAQKKKDPKQKTTIKIPCKHGSLAKTVPHKDGFTLLYPTTYAKIKKGTKGKRIERTVLLPFFLFWMRLSCLGWFSVGICKYKPGYKSRDLL